MKTEFDNIEEYEEKRKKIFQKIDDLDNVIHILEATANCYYSPRDKGWNILLTARDKVKRFIEKEKEKLYAEVQEMDKFKTKYEGKI